MKQLIIHFILILLTVWTSKVAFAETEKRVIAYKPPLVVGRPSQRIGGGSRGGENTPTVVVLAPEHTGQTIKAQPTLYWLTKQADTKSVYFTLIYADSKKLIDHPEPLLKVALTAEPSLQKLDLAEHNVSLAFNEVYKWTITVSLDAKQRSKDVIASGTIRRVSHLKQLSTAEALELPVIYAEAGLWYDAFHTLTQLIEMQPNNKTLRQQRVELLRQVGLEKITPI